MTDTGWQSNHDVPLVVHTAGVDNNKTCHTIISMGQRHVIQETTVKTVVNYAEFADPADMPVPFEVTIKGYVWVPKGGDEDA